MKTQINLIGILTLGAFTALAAGGGSVGSSKKTQLPSLEMKWDKGGPNNLISLQVARYLVQKEAGNPDLVSNVGTCRLDKPLTLGYHDLEEVNLVNLVFEGGKKLKKGNAVSLIWVTHNVADAYGYGFQIKDLSLSTNGKNTILQDNEIVSGFQNSYIGSSQGTLDFLSSSGIKISNQESAAGNGSVPGDVASTYEKSEIENLYFYEDYKDISASGKSLRKIKSAKYAMSLITARDSSRVENLRTFIQIENNQIVSVKLRGLIDDVDQTLCLKSADLAGWLDNDKNYLIKLLP